MTDRRRFLSWLAGTPLLAAAGVDHRQLLRLLTGGSPDHHRALQLVQDAAQDPPITAASQALNVFDFEPVAQRNIPIAHWAYLMTGSDDDATIRANREAYGKWALRMRRLIDVSRVDASVTLLGRTYPTPIVLCPVGSQKGFHAEGELAVARAAKAKDHLQVLSTVATTSVEDVSTARGEPVWYQLYHRLDWAQTRQLVKRVERAGCPAIVFTVDLLGGSNRETLLRGQQLDPRECANCHQGGKPQPGISGLIDDRDNRRKPNIATFQPEPPVPEKGTPTWDFVRRLRDATTMKVFLKGIVTGEDAALAVRHGVDGLFVSNHGGRAENSLRGTLESLPEVVAAVRGRIPVEVDGGVRRGTDVFKALALGASAVGVGRPYVWGLGAFGQEGVETVLTLLRRELELVMRQAGTTSVARIARDRVVPRTP